MVRVRLVALLAVVLTLGCQAEPAIEPAGPAAAPTTPAPATTPAGSPDPAGSSQPLRELSGVVQAGVEAGCLLLSGSDGDGEVWLLVGETGSIAAGDQVRLEGRATPDLMTTCQQGTPFTVTRVL